MKFTEKDLNNGVPLSKEEFIKKIKTDNVFNNKWGDLGPIYGKQWVNWGGYKIISGEEVEGLNKGINQIQVAMDMLKNNPDGRRILVSAWNPTDIPEMVLPPCHWAFELYSEEMTWDERESYFRNSELYNSDNVANDTHESMDTFGVPKRKLSLKWHQRSVDTPLGLPFNIASYAFLLEMIAQQVNMAPDKLIGDLTNVHIYENQIDGVAKQLGNDVGLHEAPSLMINKADDIFSYKLEDFEVKDYTSYPTVKYPLSN